MQCESVSLSASVNCWTAMVVELGPLVGGSASKSVCSLRHIPMRRVFRSARKISYPFLPRGLYTSSTTFPEYLIGSNDLQTPGGRLW